MSLEVDTVTLDAPNGRLTLVPSAGRVLQASLKGETAYWTNPDVQPGDWNIGGDRLWIGPEAAWFWKSLDGYDPSNHEVQPSVDPGDWRIASNDDLHYRLVQEIEVRHQHRSEGVRLSVARCFSLVGADMPLFASSVAYQTDTELVVEAGPEGEHVSLWSLLQIPPGGTLWISCAPRVEYRDYFDPAPADHIGVDGAMLRLLITGRRRLKIGVAPRTTTGRFAYVRPIENGDLLVVYREFVPRPWAAYCDPPLSALGRPGDALYAYNDGGEYGGFGEMEYQSPAVTIGRGVQRVTDTVLTVVGIVPADSWTEWHDVWLERRGE